MSKRHEDFVDHNHIWTWKGEDDHYIWCYERLNNTIYGDTDSIYLSIESVIPRGVDNLDLACEVADAVADEVNNSFPDFCRHAFNCPPDRTDIIKTGREVVSDKSFFLTKKRYIMRVLDDEGKRVDQIKMVGVEIKKSDTSEAVREILTELVDMILDDMPRSDLMERINEIRQEFRNRDIFNIAVPSGCKTLYKANSQYRTEGNLKGIHYAAKAAWHWNNIKTDQDEEIYSGEKVGLVYVKHPDFNCLAYPIDLQTLPEWYLEIPVDYDKMWDGAYKKITNYLKAMGWDFASVREQIREDLFGF